MPFFYMFFIYIYMLYDCTWTIDTPNCAPPCDCYRSAIIDDSPSNWNILEYGDRHYNTKMGDSLFSYCRDNKEDPKCPKKYCYSYLITDFYKDAESPTTCKGGLEAVLLGVCKDPTFDLDNVIEY
eukprot:527984_1